MSTVKEAIQAFQSNDFATARRICQELIPNGDIEARYMLGAMISAGHGGAADPATAAQHYRLAAEAGHAAARASLAAQYALGRGVTQDFPEAMRWYKLAADAGDLDSLFKIGIMYARGEGVAQDLEEAGRWWQRASGTHAGAMRCMGQLYAGGQGGCPKDAAIAAEWYIKAHHAGDEIAFSLLVHLQPDLEAAADDGSAMAQAALGVVLLFAKKQGAAAAVRFEQAAAKNHLEALRCLAVQYGTANGVPENQDRATELFLRAAELGDKFSQFSLAGRYNQAVGLTRDVSQAIKWYRRAANQGMHQAYLPLAQLLAERNRDRRDANEAVQRLMLVAIGGPKDAEYQIRAGDGSWSVMMSQAGTLVAMNGLNMDELHGLPEED